MKSFAKTHPVFSIALLAIVVLVTRLPFIHAGYGNEPHAWRIAYVAQQFSQTGVYSYSRAPGHPVQEIVSSFFWKGGPAALNFASVVMSVVAVVFFVLILRVKGYREYALSGLTFALIPAVYIASVSSIYYIWALAFYLASMYFVLIRRPVLAGIALGLAAGCAISHITLFIPLTYLLFTQEKSLLSSDGKMRPNITGEAGKGWLKFACATLISCVLCLLPVIVTYGLSNYALDMSNFSVNTKYAQWSLTRGTWGTFGTVGVLIAIASSIVLLWKHPKDVSRLVEDPFLIANLITIGIFTLYLIIDSQNPYNFLPIVPSFLFIIYQILNKRMTVLINSILILSAFIGFAQFKLAPGPILADYQDRIFWMKFTERVTEKVRELPEKSIIVAGDWFSKLRVELPGHPKDKFTQYAYTLNDESKANLENGYTTYVAKLVDGEAQAYIDKGYRIYYLPDSVRYTNYSGKDQDKISALFGESSADARLLMEQYDAP